MVSLSPDRVAFAGGLGKLSSEPGISPRNGQLVTMAENTDG